MILTGLKEEDVIGKISDIVKNAGDEIRRIVAEAQEEIHMLKADFCRSLDARMYMIKCDNSVSTSGQTYEIIELNENATIAQTCLGDNHDESSLHAIASKEDYTDYDIDDMTLHLELSFDDDDPDDIVLSDVSTPLSSDISHQSISFHATKLPANMTDVNLLHELRSDHCYISSDTLINTDCISSNVSDQHSNSS